VARRIAASLSDDFAAIRDATLPALIMWPGRPKTCIGGPPEVGVSQLQLRRPPILIQVSHLSEPDQTAPALRELEAIGDYIARGSPRASARIVTRVFACVDMLADHPEMGRPGRIAGTRELVVTDTPVIVPYRVHEDRVEVLSAFHGARRWPESFD
jgi:plasmid stabilization system protein ParE